MPILDGRTPQEAVADPDGREVVAALLVQFERDTARTGQPTDPAVFIRLRERLGLPPTDA